MLVLTGFDPPESQECQVSENGNLADLDADDVNRTLADAGADSEVDQ